jgi:hypothetical protein
MPAAGCQWVGRGCLPQDASWWAGDACRRMPPIAVSCDNASVFTGKWKGVVKLLSGILNRQILVLVDGSHLLQTALGEVTKEDVVYTELDNSITGICAFYNMSSKRFGRLQELRDDEDPAQGVVRTFPGSHNVRWGQRRCREVTSILENAFEVALHAQEEAGFPEPDALSTGFWARVRGLQQVLLPYKALNDNLQVAGIHIIHVGGVVAAAAAQLQRVKTEELKLKGHVLSLCETRGEEGVLEWRNNFCDALMAAIKAKFEVDADVMERVEFLDRSIWCDRTCEGCPSCEAMVVKTAAVYSKVFGAEEEEVCLFTLQWQLVVRHMKRTFVLSAELGPWMDARLEGWPLAQKLISYALVVAPGSCGVERAFSKMNVGHKRNLLNVDRLVQQYMLNSFLADKTKEERLLLVDAAMNRWLADHHRRLTKWAEQKKKKSKDCTPPGGLLLSPPPLDRPRPPFRRGRGEVWEFVAEWVRWGPRRRTGGDRPRGGSGQRPRQP